MPPLAPETTAPCYRTAMIGLRALEAREGRGQRFGHAAQGRWRSFAGGLEDRDRLDLLLRAAATTAPLAFAPRSVFALGGLAEDEPFGPGWAGPPKGLAGELLRDALAPLTSTSVREILDLARKAWALPAFEPRPALTGVIERLSAATKVLVAGAEAITTIALAAQGRTDLDLATQAVLVADAPSERQLFGLALVLLQARARGHSLAPSDATGGRLRALGFSRIDLALTSDDASPAVGDGVRRATAELTG